MAEQTKAFDLRARRNPVAGTIVAFDGKEYPVLKMNGGQYQRVDQFNDTTPVPELYDMVKELVPELPDDERLMFDRETCRDILVIAGQGIAAVEAMFPNAASPATPTSPG